MLIADTKSSTLAIVSRPGLTETDKERTSTRPSGFYEKQRRRHLHKRLIGQRSSTTSYIFFGNDSSDLGR
jgi:hypothetical protein